MTRAELIAINRKLRAADESNKWPISGAFNATERAIRCVYAQRRDGGELSVSEYEMIFDAELSRIVNDERNW
jgi:hypothetical protein